MAVPESDPRAHGLDPFMDSHTEIDQRLSGGFFNLNLDFNNLGPVRRVNNFVSYFNKWAFSSPLA